MIELPTGIVLQGLDLVNPQTYAFIRDFGLPTLLVLVLLSFVLWISRRDDQRQLKADARYEGLVNRFINDFKEISNVHEKTVNTIVERHATSVTGLSREHTASIDKLIEEIRPIIQQLILIAERLDKHDDKSDKVLEYIYESQKIILKDERELHENEKINESKRRSITAKRV